MSNLVKQNLHSAIAQSVYREIVSRNAKYFYYLGGTSDQDASNVNDSLFSERQVRDNIVLLKALHPTDVAMVVPRINWVSGEIYDQFDDRYSGQLVGINITDAGKYYNTAPTVEINTTSGQPGQGASAEAILNEDGSIKAINIINGGTGYSMLNPPTIAFSGAVIGFGGHAATASPIIVNTLSGDSSIEAARFYVITPDNRVYKCIDNNNTSPSTVMPSSIGSDVFSTEDGYSWKFLYRIPPNLANKFLTPDYIPVINSLSDNFYDVGSIGRINIESGGSNYELGNTKIEISGDGYLKTNPFSITGISVISGGTSYTSGTTIMIDDPLISSGDVITYTPSAIPTPVSRGQFVKSGNRFFEVIKGGSLQSTITPISDPTAQVICDDVFLQFVGETALATIPTISSGVISSVNLLGKIYDIDIINVGEGYPDGSIYITIMSGVDVVMTAIGMCKNGKLQKINLTSASALYTTLPELSYTVGTPWTSDSVVSVNTVVFNGNYIYKRVSANPAGSIPPTHLSGVVGVWEFLGTKASVQAKLSYGYGYKSAPEITIIGSSTVGSGADIRVVGEKTNAKVLPVIESGSIVDCIIVDGGIGYTYADVIVSSASGSGAKLSTNVFVGSIDTLEANNILSNVVGGIHNIPVVSGGVGYSSDDLPIISIVGDGEDATAIPVIVDGRVSKIEIINPGKNYTYASVSITTPTGSVGTSASARAIISPYGGHSRDNIKELFAKRVMTYSKLQGEKFSGFTIANDYRLFGLIKNPKNFEDTAYISTSLATSCYIVYCTFNSAIFTKDSIVTVTGKPTKKFKIVDTTTGAMILQDLSNYNISAGEYLEITVGSTTTKTEVQDIVLPTFGKYTGELLNIDSRTSGFTSTVEQSIVIRTILGWDTQTEEITPPP